MVIYKALGLLLTYPSSELLAAKDEIRAIVAASGLSDESSDQLDTLIAEFDREPLLDLQERYVDLFDRTRALSLHLFEHVHGTGRDRGQAMVQLQTMYGQHGLSPTGAELPDYLPMLCEFLSLLPPEGARAMLGDLVVILGLLRHRLQERGTAYAAVPAALLELAEARAGDAELEAVLAADELPLDPPRMDELDEQWAEAEVTFGVGDAHESCNGDDRASDLVQVRRPIRREEKAEKTAAKG